MSPLQRRALQVMNIDLYVMREATSHAARDAASHVPRDAASIHPQAPNVASDVLAAPPLASVDASSAEVAAPAAADRERERSVAVALDCLAGAGVVAIGTFAEAADARFAQDILAALLGSGTPLQRSAFKWPQTQTGDPSRAAAERAYAGFLNGQTDRAAARLLLLLGPAATMLLPAERADAGYALLECAAIGELRRDPAQKKALWLSIRRFANR
jgi:hypothetical protein